MRPPSTVLAVPSRPQTSVLPAGPPTRSSSRRIGPAFALSVVAHLLALSAFTPGGDRPSPENALSTRLPPLSATLVQRDTSPAADMAAPRPSAASRPWPAPEPALADVAAPPEGSVSPSTDNLPAPEATRPPSPAASRHIPTRFIPIAELTRPPELISYVDERRWPSMPGVPAGKFRLKVSIGADGHVKKIQPDCEEALCEAAQIYTDIVGQWLFLPGEVLGTQVPSLLILEFQVKGDSSFPGIDQLPPRQ